MGLIVDESGKPLEGERALVPDRGRGLRAQGEGGPGWPSGAPLGLAPYQFPYDAANWFSQQFGNWLPWIRSPDSEINLYRDRMVARSRDLSRNDGWINGAVNRILDNTIGTNLQLCANPDYRALALRFGITAFDANWADEFRRTAEALWRGYAENAGRFNDVARQLTLGQQFRLAMRHKLIDGDGLGLVYWLPGQVGYAGADYATALLLVDPDRLCNPYQMIDSANMRGGVEIDDNGAPVAYHVRKAEPNDWYLAIEANTWERIERYDEDGWQRVLHDFDRDRAGQHRGIGVFTPVLAHAKMLARYYEVELQAAAIGSIFGTYVTSPYDPALVQDALGAGDGEELPLYQSLRAQWANERPAYLNGARIPTLAPGESLENVSATHPHSNFEMFTHEMQRVFAATLGLSAEQVTQDWSKTNYSSARAALLEAWKTLQRRRDEFCLNFASPFYASWLWEAMDRGELPLPDGAPPFAEARSAYARCSWMGVARGWIDPTKEKAGAVMGMDAAISTLKRECAEQGLDYEEVLHQRANEIRLMHELGLTPPDWAGDVAAAEAAKVTETPQPQ
ncbi:phage portal protein [Paraburkholderia mimosarum]|uniref:phage portal protein n=1 Tax=Paraburkholderia mimosarum TaxID=312026 RepID=UPI000418AD5E|nr:phage portal protein [Paraburkholderia mimosarum]